MTLRDDTLSARQAAIVGAFTGVLMGPFHELQEYAEELMGRPVMTHEFAFAGDDIKEAARADFLAICRTEDTD